MVQMQASPYMTKSDDFLAKCSSFSLLMVFFCCFVFKIEMLVSSPLRVAMSPEQQSQYSIPRVFSYILFLSVLGAVLFSGALVVQQILIEVKTHAGSPLLIMKRLSLDAIRPLVTPRTSNRESMTPKDGDSRGSVVPSDQSSLGLTSKPSTSLFTGGAADEPRTV
jgi:hypothetical protein